VFSLVVDDFNSTRRSLRQTASYRHEQWINTRIAVIAPRCAKNCVKHEMT